MRGRGRRKSRSHGGGLLSHVVLLGYLIRQWEAREQEEATHRGRLGVDEAAGDKDGRPAVDDK